MVLSPVNSRSTGGEVFNASRFPDGRENFFSARKSPDPVQKIT